MAIMPSVGKEFEIVKSGRHKGRLVRIIDLGTQKGEYEGVVSFKHKALLMWELPETEITEGEFEGKPFFVSLFATVSLHEKSVLGPLLVGWRGKEFTDKEKAEFNLLELLDKPFEINVIHKESGDKTRAKVHQLSPLAEEDCPARVNDLVAFDLSEFDQEVFDSLSDKIKDIIMKSPEYKIRNDENKGDIAVAEKQLEEEPPF